MKLTDRLASAIGPAAYCQAGFCCTNYLTTTLDYARTVPKSCIATVAMILILVASLLPAFSCAHTNVRSGSEWKRHQHKTAGAQVLHLQPEEQTRPPEAPRLAKSRAEPGPKSWCRGRTRLWLSGLLLLSSPTLSHCIPVKPRVSPVAATGEEAPPHDSRTIPATGAKHSGEGQILLHREQTIRKTALKTAIKHAKGTSVALYRGRPLRTEASTPPPNSSALPVSAAPPVQQSTCRRRNNRRLSVITYNCAGLTSALYQELLVWLTIRQPDIVFLQETHWAEDRDYVTEQWHIVSSGCSTRHSGVMILLSKASFPQPCIRSEILVSGRLLLVKAQCKTCCHYLINIYQKVHDGSKEGLHLRSQIWEALQKAISTSPSRHSLIVAGDFNTGLRSCAPYTGSAVIGRGNATDAPDAHMLHQMLKQFDLRALNTFQSTPGPTTFQHPEKGGKVRRSQIDYIIIRGRRTDTQAKHAHTLVDTDLGAWRGGPKHWPAQVTIPAECYYSPQTQPRRDASKSTNIQVKQGKLHLKNPEDFQQAVHSRLQCLDSWNTQVINCILQDEMQSRLVPTDLRPAYVPHDATAPVKTMWKCHRDLKALQQVDTEEAEGQRLLLKQQFTQLQRQVRSMSKLKRQAYIEDCVQRATQAAQRGDIREIYLQVNKVAPKVIRRRPQLRDDQGHILQPQQETEALQKFWQDVYKGRHPHTPEPLGGYLLPPALLEAALASLPQHKSLPNHYAPGITWKLAASSVAALAQRTILNDWHLDRFWIPSEWRHAWLCFILKPNKSGRKAEEYRPIGLTDPVGKAVLGAVSTQHCQAFYDSVAEYPQFAYTANRGVSQALMRAFQHLHQARKLVAEQRVTLQQSHAGVTRCKLVGAITVSLDMSKAFDSLEPKYMHQALELSCLPDDVCRLIEHWHADAVYHFEHEQCQAQIPCGRGIRQGCKIAPRVWSLFTILIMHEIGPQWCQKHSTWFADDALFQVVFHSEEDLFQQIRVISKALWVLQQLGMSIAASKSAVLVHLGGTTAKRIKDKLIKVHNQKQHVVFQHDGHTWRLPVVTKHDYLGATLSYTRMEDLTVTRRIRAAQASFDRLKPVIAHKALALTTRLRIWQACVVSSLLYALPQVGLTSGAAQRVAVSFYRQLRHITRQPVHLTGISNLRLCAVHGVADPIESLAHSASKQQAKTARLQHTLAAQDARFSEDILACETRLATQLQAIMQDRKAGHVKDAPQAFPCQQCDYVAGSKTALTKHRNKVHQAGLQQSSYLDWKAVDRFVHGTNGLPTCSCCGKDFSSWQQLQRHVFDKVCQPQVHTSVIAAPQADLSNPEAPTADEVLTSSGPDALKDTTASMSDPQPSSSFHPEVAPLYSQPVLSIEPSPVPDTAVTAQCSEQPQPVYRDNEAMQIIRQHSPLEVLQQHPRLQAELSNHCCLCRQWTPQRGGTKIHLRGSHKSEWTKAGSSSEHKCLSHAHHVSSRTGCPFCLAPTFADKRAARAHAQNCQVLYQLIFLNELCLQPAQTHAEQKHCIVLKSGEQLQIAMEAPTQSSPTETQRQFLLKHCCICAQVQPNLRSLKTHLHKAHPQAWVDTDSLSRACKTLLTTADKTCPYCLKTSRIAKDHAPYCPVIFQFCLLKHLHIGSVPQREAANNGGGGAGAVVPSSEGVHVGWRIRGKQSQQALQTRSRRDDRTQPEGHRQGEGQTQEQGSADAGTRMGWISRSAISPLRAASGVVERCAGPRCGGCHLCNGQALSEAGDRTQRASAGEVLPSPPQCSAAWNTQATDPGLLEVERSSRSDEGRLQPQVRAVLSATQGDGGAPGEVRTDSGKSGSSGEGPVAEQLAHAMALSEMGSRAAGASLGSKPPRSGAPGGQGLAGEHAGSHQARSRCAEQVCSEAQIDRGHAGELRSLQGEHWPQRSPLRSPLRGLRQAVWLGCAEPHRSQHAQGEAEAWQRSGRSPQSDLALKCRLLNPSGTNTCYANSAFLLLVHASAQVGMPHGLLGTLGTSVRDLASAQPVWIRNLPQMQAVMRLWIDPNRQHDVAEFFSHLVRHSRMPFGQECWQAREIRGPVLHVLDEGSLCTPIPLHFPASPVEGQALTFQDCAEQFFRGQARLCALASAAPLLCFQLKRYVFDVNTGVTHKCTAPVWFLETTLQVPVWQDADTLRVRQVPYQISAIAFHEGPTPNAGHYRTCLLHQGHYYVTDDGVGAKRAAPQMLETVQENSYLFLCTLQLDG